MITEKQEFHFYIGNDSINKNSKSDNKLFAGNIDFIKGIKSINEMPIGDFIEICFSGRSNVGKSSLINYLTGRRSIARTSKTPGRTREINFFRINNNRQLVDLPGYGYAQVSKKERQAWFKMVKDYFFHSNNLRRVFLLIDSRHGIKPSDIDLMKILEEAAITFQLVFTKFDKIKPNEFDKIKKITFTKLSLFANAFPEVIVTSTKKNVGIEALRASIGKLFI
ncbi:MAG: ribosome biogenesis GTP-binding protein YihA/YsxC [Paracoccaceae bacterium]